MTIEDPIRAEAPPPPPPPEPVPHERLGAGAGAMLAGLPAQAGAGLNDVLGTAASFVGPATSPLNPGRVANGVAHFTQELLSDPKETLRGLVRAEPSTEPPTVRWENLYNSPDRTQMGLNPQSLGASNAVEFMTHPAMTEKLGAISEQYGLDDPMRQVAVPGVFSADGEPTVLEMNGLSYGLIKEMGLPQERRLGQFGVTTDGHSMRHVKQSWQQAFVQSVPRPLSEAPSFSLGYGATKANRVTPSVVAEIRDPGLKAALEAHMDTERGHVTSGGLADVLREEGDIFTSAHIHAATWKVNQTQVDQMRAGMRHSVTGEDTGVRIDWAKASNGPHWPDDYVALNEISSFHNNFWGRSNGFDADIYILDE